MNGERKGARKVMEIRELTTYTQEAHEQLSGLMKQLSARCEMTESELRATIEDRGSHLYCMLDEGRIVGCATLCTFHSPTGAKASIEDVVVDEGCRGQGLGRILMEHVMKEAEQMGPIQLQLTSKPSRVAANRLYQSLGFEKKETNCYRR